MLYCLVLVQYGGIISMLLSMILQPESSWATDGLMSLNPSQLMPCTASHYTRPVLECAGARGSRMELF